MDKMDNLSLDPIQVDTGLAEEYLKAHINFQDWPPAGKYWHVKKYPNEKVEYLETTKSTNIIVDEISTTFTNAHLGRKLAEKIEENVLLFSQLEYIIRKTDTVDVKNNIKLISQHLQCCDLKLWNQVNDATIPIIMDEKKALYTLGCVAVGLYRDNIKVNIVTSQKMAPLCHLFCDICAELGWEIPLIFAHNPEWLEAVYEYTSPASDITEFECTGVITESADIESALDLFINSSTAAPWKLQRIFVQESVFDEVKEALAWKCTRERVDSCADAFATRGKLFLCDALSAAQEHLPCVPVEAYRTAREARALLAQLAPRGLSVWAADAGAAHELALAAPARLVWINDYAVFDGPPEASLPLYEEVYPVFPYPIDDALLQHVTELRDAWSKLAESERVDSVMRALQDFRSSSSLGCVQAAELQDAIYDGLGDSFASVNGARIWFGVERNVDSLTKIEVFDSFDMLKVLHTAIKGGAVLYNTNGNAKFTEILEFLTAAGVPLGEHEGTDEDVVDMNQQIIYRKFKVISTNFGTIFAN